MVGTEARAKYNAYAARRTGTSTRTYPMVSQCETFSVIPGGAGDIETFGEDLSVGGWEWDSSKESGRRRVPFGCCVCKAFCSAQRSGGKAP